MKVKGYKITKIKRGADFALAGAGKSGIHTKDTKGFNNKKERKQIKQELKKYHKDNRI